MKSIVQNKRGSNDEDSSDEDNDDSVPGLQDRNRPDSSSKIDEKNNRSDIEDYLDTEDDDQYYTHLYDLSKTAQQQVNGSTTLIMMIIIVMERVTY